MNATTRTRSKFSFQKSNRWFFLAFATAACWILMVSNAWVSGEYIPKSTATSSGTSADTISPGTDVTPDDIPGDHGVIDLTSKNFGSMVGLTDGKVWLIEFYTPSCSHCLDFMPTYNAIAETLHTSRPDEKIRVARVNCSEERALMTRFGVNRFPSFFLVAGWEVYEFNGPRSSSSLIEFSRGGYKKKTPIPFMNSPMGPMGVLQGTLIFVGTRVVGLLEDIETKFGISPIISGLIICMVGVFCGMISIILLTVFATPKSSEKSD